MCDQIYLSTFFFLYGLFCIFYLFRVVHHANRAYQCLCDGDEESLIYYLQKIKDYAFVVYGWLFVFLLFFLYDMIFG